MLDAAFAFLGSRIDIQVNLVGIMDGSRVSEALPSSSAGTLWERGVTKPVRPSGGPWLDDDRLTTRSPISKGPSVIAAATLLKPCNVSLTVRQRRD